MPCEVHVSGRIEPGRFHEFIGAVEEWRAWRHERGLAVPEVLQGLSGEMNTVLLVFRYADLGEYEREEAAESADPEYARVATRMPFEGTLDYRLFRIVEP